MYIDRSRSGEPAVQDAEGNSLCNDKSCRVRLDSLHGKGKSTRGYCPICYSRMLAAARDKRLSINLRPSSSLPPRAKYKAVRTSHFTDNSGHFLGAEPSCRTRLDLLPVTKGRMVASNQGYCRHCYKRAAWHNAVPRNTRPKREPIPSGTSVFLSDDGHHLCARRRLPQAVKFDSSERQQKARVRE